MGIRKSKQKPSEKNILILQSRTSWSITHGQWSMVMIYDELPYSTSMDGENTPGAFELIRTTTLGYRASSFRI